MFLHISELEAASIDPATIKKGQRIVYEAITFNGKPKASNVRLTDGPVSAFGDRQAAPAFWRGPNGFPGLAEKAQVEHPVVGIGFDVPLYGAVQRGE
jgi:hypothetical protein